MIEGSFAVGAAVHPGRGAKTAGVGRENDRRQSNGLNAHDRQDRQDDGKTAPTDAGQIVDAENFFRFVMFQQKKWPPSQNVP